MAYLNAALLGVIEGITEFLPISSTGHLLIAEHWLGKQSDTFNVAIQSGAMLAVTIVYWRRILSLLAGWQAPENFAYLSKIVVATLITICLGLVAEHAGFKLPDRITPIAIALIAGGLWIMAAERLAALHADRTHITWFVALAVGVAQIVAGIFPGTSRSGATIFAAMLTGTSNRSAATEFAFLVGIPTMYAASAYELFKTARDGTSHEDWVALSIGFAVSALTAFVAVKWLLGYIRHHRYTAFAVYRILLGAALFAVPGVIT